MERDAIEMDALRAKDQLAWAKAFKQLWPIALRGTQYLRLGLTLEDAEEAANESLAQVAKKVDAIATFQEMKALVVVAAYRNAVSMNRKRFAQKRLVPDTSSEPAREEESGSESVPGFAVACSQLSHQETAELVLLLRDLLSKLDATTSNLVLEHVAHGTTLLELSQKHGVPLGTICPKVARAVGKLRKILRESPRLMQELRGFLRY